MREIDGEREMGEVGVKGNRGERERVRQREEEVRVMKRE